MNRRGLLAAALCLGCGCASPGPAFVDLAHVDDSIEIDMRYAGENNFAGERIDGYGAARCWLTEPAARALGEVQSDLGARGLGLLVYDCYRPQRAVDHFGRWAEAPADPAKKAEYHPAFDKPRLIELGYIATRSGHSRGSTVDLTVIERSGAPNGPPLDMGTRYDFFDAASNTESPRVTPQQRENRLLLRAAMERAGFENFPKEWWHYTLRDEPYPNDYWDVPIE